MPIITMTTDFGLHDYYVPIIKGAIVSKAEQINIIDISHNIKNYDIVQAAFVLTNSYKYFPLGTVHLVTVNNAEQGISRMLILAQNGHFFISPDNGIFSLMFGNVLGDIYVTEHQLTDSFSMNMAFADTAAQLAMGIPPENLGTLATDLVQRISIQPVLGHSVIRGSVIQIDNYENVITNITRDLFERIHHRRDYQIQFKRHDALMKVYHHYSDVPVGDTLCLFNSAGYLEIAINMGMAASMLGLGLDDTIQVDFQQD